MNSLTPTEEQRKAAQAFLGIDDDAVVGVYATRAVNDLAALFAQRDSMLQQRVEKAEHQRDVALAVRDYVRACLAAVQEDDIAAGKAPEREVALLREELMLTMGKLALANGVIESYRQDLREHKLDTAHILEAYESGKSLMEASMTEDEVVCIQKVTADGNLQTVLTDAEIQRGFDMAKRRLQDIRS